MTIKIGSNEIGASNCCFVIAEASSNHGGQIERAKKMIDVAAEAGVDAVKFQVFTAAKLAADTDDPRTLLRAKEKRVFVEKDTKLIDLYRENELPRIWLPELAKYAQQKGLIFLATPFDSEAVDQLEAVEVPAYKVASYELLNVPLLRKIASKRKPIILSTGMATLGEIEFALQVVHPCPTILLHCNSIYPTPPDQVNLCAMETMREAFPHCPIGFSDHSLGITVPLAAVALGAKVIEKHFFLDDNERALDDKFSLTPRELKLLVEGIRTVEQALGSSEKKPSPKEEWEKVQARSSLWVIKDIQKGEVFSEDNINSLRPGIGLSSQFYDVVIGKKAARNMKAQTPLAWEDFLQ